MFQEFVINFSDKVFGEDKNKKFYILTNKKHNREIYVECYNKKALKFIKPKMRSFKKRIIYFFLRCGFMQLFLKKIKLNKDIGNVIYYAGQIKSFDLNKEVVYSGCSNEDNEKRFINSKLDQKKLAKYGFAPKIYVYNKRAVYSKEELLENYKGNYFEVIKKLFKFYKEVGIKKIFYNGKYYLTTITHGDFAKENLLKKNGEVVFIDFNLKRGLIISDLVNYFRFKKNLLKNKEFLRLLKFYPKEVQENINDYLELNSKLNALK